MTDQFAITRAQVVEQGRQHIARRLTIELAQQVAVARGDEHRVADRAATLRHDRIDVHVAAKRQEYGSAPVGVMAQIQEIAARLAAAAREATNLERARKRTIETWQDFLGRERERIRDE